MLDWEKEMQEADAPKQYEEIVRVLGGEGAEKLCRYYGGETLYIPDTKKMENRQRNREIRRRHGQGMSIARLAGIYGLSRRGICKVLKEKG